MDSYQDILIDLIIFVIPLPISLLFKSSPINLVEKNHVLHLVLGWGATSYGFSLLFSQHVLSLVTPHETNIIKKREEERIKVSDKACSTNSSIGIFVKDVFCSHVRASR